jgi:hypothetical protein
VDDREEGAAMTQPVDEPNTGNTSRETGEDTAGDLPAPLAAAPAAMGSGSATPLAAPAAFAGSGVTDNDGDNDRDAPDREAFLSGEDEVGGSDGPAGGTRRP